ncbi:HD-GYP domain-containing protein [Paenibacillus alginolyticus]|nr:HD domain-containing phosphohydrolase [Paenibacillus alginolyticus]MEC0144314.1 HD domain-containing protein [Paenibacillus alginolyticus]
MAKDEVTYSHSLRLGSMAKIMANHLRFDEEQKENLIIGCCLHDYGKIFTPEKILHKESALTSKEWEIMKRHPVIGARLLILENVEQEIIDVVKYHHERIDGKGYPYGLKGDEIPNYSKICSIIDSYDSMVSNRVYRKGLTPLQAREELMKHSGTQFDEFYVREFVSIPQDRLESRDKIALRR